MKRTDKAPRWATVLAVFAAAYAPYLRGLFSDCAHCRALWLKLFPVAPGAGVLIFVQSWFRRLDLSPFALYALAGGVTMLLLAGLFFLARGSWRRLAVVTLPVFVATWYPAMALYAVLRA